MSSATVRATPDTRAALSSQVHIAYTHQILRPWGCFAGGVTYAALALADVSRYAETARRALTFAQQGIPMAVEGYGPQSDVWSAGIVFYELLSGAGRCSPSASPLPTRTRAPPSLPPLC